MRKKITKKIYLDENGIKKDPTITEKEIYPRESLSGLSVVDIIYGLGEGVKESRKILSIIKDRYMDKYFIYTCLEDMNMRGYQIWLGYQACGQDINRFIRFVIAKDDNMINAINLNSAYQGFSDKVVKSGAISARNDANRVHELYFSPEERIQLSNDLHEKIQEEQLKVLKLLGLDKKLTDMGLNL